MTNQKSKIPKVWLLKKPFEFKKMVKDPASYFKNTLDENDGLIKLMITNRYATMTDRPELIRHVLQKNNKNYIKAKIIKKVLKKQIGNGLLTSDGGYWLKQRRAIQPGFHKKRLEGISKIMIDEINHYMDNVMDRYAEEGTEIDLAEEMLHLAFKVVSKALFGNAIKDENLDLIGQMINETQQLVVDEMRMPFVKFWLHLSGRYKKSDLLKEKIYDIIQGIIKERKESKQKYDDLLDMLLETKYEDGTGMTDQQIMDEVIILYIAGHETSAVAMSWAWYLLMTHPEIEEKLLKSVKESIADEDPSFGKLRDLAYALQVMEETMRIYPPGWVIDRESLEDDEFEGVSIEKGMNVICLIYSLHHNPKYWKNPGKFDPDRFTPENKKKQIPFSYLPFGAGPRLCIGSNFALMEMQIILAMMIKRYEFELIEGQDIDINPLITLRSRNGIKTRVRKRK